MGNISKHGRQEDVGELSTILQTMSEGLVIQSESGAVEKFNPEALKILGLTADQLVGRTSMDPRWKSVKEDGSPYHGEDHPAMVALRTNEAVRNAIMGLTLPSGDERWIKINAVPFSSSGARKVAVTFADITEWIKANRDIKHIFQYSVDLMCIAGTDGNFKKVSPSFEKLLGWSASDLLSQPFANFIHPEDIAATAKEVEKLSRGIVTIHFENRYRTKTGQYLLISWVCDCDTKTGLLYATGRDVTEQRKLDSRNAQIFRAIDQVAILAFTDPAGKITEVNDNFCKVSGYSRSELIGKDHRLVNSRVHNKGFFKNLWNTISSGQTWSGDIQNQKKNGDAYFVRSVIAPIKSTDGAIEQYVAARFDVTDQKKAEIELLEAQRIAKIGSWKYDLRTGHQTWSSEHYRIFEIEEPQSQENLYRHYRERIHPEDRARLDSIVEVALKRGENFVFDHRVSLDGGARIKYVQGIGKVTKDALGNPLYISGTCQDLTEAKLLQEQLEIERAKSAHAAKLASLGEMSAGIAHEINNPLGVIAGNIPLLQKFKNDPEKFTAKVGALLKASDRIERIVKGLKKFSRSSDKSPRKRENLKNLVNEALVITDAKSRRHSTPISCEIAGDLEVLCDGVEIEQVIVNLINNAIDAVKDMQEKWVKVESLIEARQVVLRVSDSGPGISQEVEKKLFQPFFTTKPVGEGTGLGLSVAKGILDQHGATILVNRTFSNTCIEIRFPPAREVNNAA